MRDQAAIVHDEAVNMVKASAGLSRYLKVNASTKVIHFPRTKSYYKALASDVNASEGKNANGIVWTSCTPGPGPTAAASSTPSATPAPPAGSRSRS